jgi:trafficking protein particle complex subunit 1
VVSQEYVSVIEYEKVKYSDKFCFSQVWSLWIYDRHCTLVFHADWSYFHNRGSGNAQNAGNNPSSSSANNIDGVNGRAQGGGKSSILPLSEQAKLVYGLVFSLRNMTKKLSPQNTENGTNQSSKETLHSFSTSTYTLAHLQTLTNYTFVMLTDPVQAPTRRAPPSATSGSGFTSSAATFSGGGGIPATGGMTTTGVLAQISRGPWVEFVARNPACLSLEREQEDEEEDDNLTDLDEDALQELKEKKEQKRILRQKEIQKQRITGIGKSVDSEAFRASVERVLAQNKLNAPRM